jgi:hypothetical protein
MAEFCLDCYNKLNNSHLTKEQVTLAIDFCEGCEQWKECIVTIKPYKKSFFDKLFR